MRHIGSLADESQARSLHSYLVTQEIRCMVEEEDGAWSVWIYEEDQIDRGKQELEAFRSAPNDPKYAAAVREATRLAKDAEKKAKEAQKRTVDVREQWQRPLYQRAPVTVALIGITVLVCAVLTDPGAPWGRGIFNFGPGLCSRPAAQYLFVSVKGKNLPEVQSGEIWRLITPIFLHFSLIHILFNMMWTRDLGAAIELRLGSWKFLGIVLISGVFSIVMTAITDGPLVGGMSGVVYALAGFVYVKGRFQPELGLFLPPRLFQFFMFWLAFGFLGMLGSRISNSAHLYGLIAGAVLAYFPIAIQKLKG